MAEAAGCSFDSVVAVVAEADIIMESATLLLRSLGGTIVGCLISMFTVLLARSGGLARIAARAFIDILPWLDKCYKFGAGIRLLLILIEFELLL